MAAGTAESSHLEINRETGDGESLKLHIPSPVTYLLQQSHTPPLVNPPRTVPPN